MSVNKGIINDIVHDLQIVRNVCDRIKLDHTKTIKVVEAKSDILRAMQKLEKLIDELPNRGSNRDCQKGSKEET